MSPTITTKCCDCSIRDPRRELKENNAMLKEHNSVVVVSSIDDNDRVRKVGVNTGNLR
jgi:hypothetical protein